MDALVAKILKKYFSIYFKTISKENINISVTEGRCVLTNLELNAPVVQELLWLPTNLEIAKAFCTRISIQANWMKLKTEPILISIDRVELTLREPLVVPPMPSLLDSQKGINPSAVKEKKVKMSRFEIGLNTTLTIKEIFVRIETLPSLTIPAWKKPSLLVLIKGLCLETTNEQGQVVDLTKSKSINAVNKNIQTMYKRLKVESLSVSLEPLNMSPFKLIEEAPIQAKISSVWNIEEVAWLGGHIHLQLDMVHCMINTAQWDFVYDFISCLKQTFSRPVPEEEQVPKPPTSTAQQGPPPPAARKPKISFQFTLAHWLFQILEKPESGFRFQGCALNFLYTHKKIKAPREIHLQKDAFIVMEFPIIKFEEVTPTRPNVILTHETEKLLTLKANWKYSKNFLHPDKVTGDSYELFDELHFDGNLSGLNIIINVATWERLFSLFSPRKNKPPPLPPRSNSAEKLPPAQARKQIYLVKDWNNIKINLETLDTVLAIHEGTRKLSFVISRMTLINDPVWEDLPLSKTTFENLTPFTIPDPKPRSRSNSVNLDFQKPNNPASKLKTFKQIVRFGISPGSLYKLECSLRGFSVNISEESNGFPTIDIIKSGSANLNIRFFQTAFENQVYSHIEVGLQYGEVSIRIEDQQFFQLYLLFKELYQSMHKIYTKNATRIQEWKDKLRNSPKQHDNEALTHSDEKNEAPAAPMSTYRFLFCCRAEKGMFELPVQSLATIFNEARLEQVSHFMNPLSRLTFEAFSFGFDSNLDSQNIILEIKTMRAEQIFHPSSSYVVSVTPIHHSTDSLFDRDKHAQHFHLSYQRIFDDVDHAFSKLHVVMQELLIQFQERQNPFEDWEYPDLHTLFLQFLAVFDTNRTLLLQTLDSLKTKIEEAKRHKDNRTDLDWEIDLGGCEVIIQDQTKKRNGALHLSSSRGRESLADQLHNQTNELVQSQMHLSKLQLENEAMKKQLASVMPAYETMQQEIEALKHLCRNLEEQYVTARKLMSEVQEENASLSHALMEKTNSLVMIYNEQHEKSRK